VVDTEQMVFAFMSTSFGRTVRSGILAAGPFAPWHVVFNPIPIRFDPDAIKIF
jgi:hypothetical protein